MTDEEKAVIEMTAALFNAIHALGDHHPCDMGEYTRDVHNIQNRVMARVAARAHPEVFRRG